MESCENKRCERPSKKGEGGGSQILFKPFVIYTGIYLSLKNNSGMCGTIRSVGPIKKVDTYNSERELDLRILCTGTGDFLILTCYKLLLRCPPFC